MLKFIGILKLIILTTLITSCQNVKYDTSDISGTWYLIFKDTTYGEVIFTKNKLWEYNEQSGTYYKSYTMSRPKIGLHELTCKHDEKIDKNYSRTGSYHC
jgi:hypothetical protein